MALRVQCTRVLVLTFVLSLGVVAHQNNRGRVNEIPQLTSTLSSEDIRRSQKEFFHLLEHTPGLKESTNVSTTIQILNTVEGQKLMRALVDSLVPTIGRDDSSELLHNFWQLLSEAVPAKVAHKLKQIEDLYGEIDSLPTALFTLITAGDKSPIALILQEVIPNFNASELLQSITPTTPSDLPGSSFAIRLLHLAKPAIDTFLRENDIDLQTDAILQMVTSLTAQFQSPEATESKTSVGKLKEKPAKKNVNPLAALLPLMGMMGKSKGKNGNNLMEGLMGMMGNGDGENIIENLLSMFSNHGENNNIFESVMGLLQGGKSGENNIMESVLKMINGGSKTGENNIADSVMGMLNSGGKTGDNNLMGMAMTLMSSMNKNKKQNDNLDMIASVVSLMSADGGRGSGSEKNPMAGIAKMAMNMLTQGGAKKNDKQDRIKEKKTVHEKIKPTDNAASMLKKEHSKSTSGSSSSSNNARSRLLQVLEPALRRLHTDAACHAKLGAVLSAGKTLLDTKAMGAKAFLMAAVPIAVAGLPGGPALLQEFGAALSDLGLKDRQLSDVLASISDEGECVTLARRAAPHLGKLVLLLAEPDVQATVWSALTEQTTAALEGLGLKGVTLSNWPQILGPMINMGAAGLPVQPVPLLSALQDHVTDLLRNSSLLLQQTRGLPLKEVIPKLEYELGSLLHHLGNVEHHLSRRDGHDTSCVAQVVCAAAQRETGLKAAILTSYSAGRGVTAVTPTVPARLEVLRAAAHSGHCETEFPCAPLPAHDSPSARHATLDYDDAAAHVEL